MHWSGQRGEVRPCGRAELGMAKNTLFRDGGSLASPAERHRNAPVGAGGSCRNGGQRPGRIFQPDVPWALIERMRTPIPSAPAGTRVTSANSWYRQENSNRSDTRITDTAEVKNSRQARAS